MNPLKMYCPLKMVIFQPAMLDKPKATVEISKASQKNSSPSHPLAAPSAGDSGGSGSSKTGFVNLFGGKFWHETMGFKRHQTSAWVFFGGKSSEPNLQGIYVPAVRLFFRGGFGWFGVRYIFPQGWLWEITPRKKGGREALELWWWEMVWWLD